jgi:hypothetical protein
MGKIWCTTIEKQGEDGRSVIAKTKGVTHDGSYLLDEQL